MVEKCPKYDFFRISFCIDVAADSSSCANFGCISLFYYRHSIIVIEGPSIYSVQRVTKYRSPKNNVVVVLVVAVVGDFHFANSD